MRALTIDPRVNQSVNVYDQTKNVLIGRWSNRVLDSKTVVGPTLNDFDDIFTNTGINTIVGVYTTPSGRQFTAMALAIGSISIMLSTYDFATGQYTNYVGRINLLMPGTGTPTLRGFKVDDTNPASMKIFIGESQATTGLTFGGLTIANNIAVTDFVQAGFPTIPYATGSNQKATYYISAATILGATNPIQAMTGFALDTATKKVYIQNGVAATWQMHVFDYNGITLNNVSQPVDSFTVATPGVVNRTAHGYVNGEAVSFAVSSGVLPTGITAGVAYFVSVVNANSFNISATPGGATIAFTAAGSPVSPVVRRGYGTSIDCPYFATGNLTALIGTLFNNNSVDLCTPQHSANSGLPCVAFGTSSSLYLIRVSDIVASATSLPGTVVVNTLGQVGEFATTITPSYVNYSTALDAFVMFVSGRFIVKQCVNNAIIAEYGVQNLQFLNGIIDPIPKLGSVTFAAMDVKNGVLFAAYTSVSQGGVIACDLSSDYVFDQQYLITPVIDTQSFEFKLFAVEMGLSGTGNNLAVYYRQSDFNTQNVGWLPLPDDWDLNLAPMSPQIQFKLAATISENPNSVAAQIGLIYLNYVLQGDGSEYWAASYDNTSSGGPTRFSFRLMKQYPTVVPPLTTKWFDTTIPVASQLGTLTTTLNASNYEYSTNDGLSWNALGTIPNTVGTIVRVTPGSPPGVKVIPNIRES